MEGQRTAMVLTASDSLTPLPATPARMPARSSGAAASGDHPDARSTTLGPAKFQEWQEKNFGELGVTELIKRLKMFKRRESVTRIAIRSALFRPRRNSMSDERVGPTFVPALAQGLLGV